jgi:LacI family transcriptional regulator
VFLSEMAARGLALPAEAIALSSHTAAGGYAAASRLIAVDDPPTALICAADLLAIGALCALQEAGWRVPHAISVVGFDDIPMATYTTPPLTTVRQPIAQLARGAAMLLLDSIEGVRNVDASSGNGMHQQADYSLPAASDQHTPLLPPELVVRRSTAVITGD